jgi:hypothetical protein
MLIEAKLRELGLVLPQAPKLPPGITISFVWTRRHSNRVYLSGHAAQQPDCYSRSATTLTGCPLPRARPPS